ncbi:endonuclease [Mycolicibacterium tokaiense]|uniref:Endonuclease n=1 Tax=Mycolicibacterium tokaiense TaxID=39695 RepID=A0A378TQQ5_9MYCO|nr:endonuclease [Mycolicibacterium tokaiense]BBY89076.1 endonuclease [Mycolicibacterium tokaiense]STZ62537.1 endonuclease [Mycolicibacterium tokaiense]
MSTPHEIAADLLDRAGTTYAADAGITLKDTPKPLFQLLVLCMLASKPIDADIAVAAAREIFHAGLRTPEAVLDADRRTMIDAFGRAGYARYDESSATRLTEMAQRVQERYDGDLRRLAEAGDRDVGQVARLLQEFTGIGPTGADIFLREVQAVWPWVAPFFDERARSCAGDLGLPTDTAELASLAPRRTAELAAALVRTALDR